MSKSIVLTPAQTAVVENRGGNLLVSAAAGSGKTKVLVDRILTQVCEESKNINQFLVITFTKAAATELRAKLLAGLSVRLANAPGNAHIKAQINRIDSAQISTVHAFCAQLLRDHAEALSDLSDDFRVMEEQDTVAMKMEAMEELLEATYRHVESKPNVQSFLDELGYGRDDKAVPAILYSVYDFVQAHSWPQEWIAQCIQSMDVRQYNDAGETPWGRYIIDDVKGYIRGNMPLIESTIKICDADEALSAAYSETLVADRAKMTDMLLAKSWDEFFAVKERPWVRLKSIKKASASTKVLQQEVKNLRDRYKKGITSKCSGIYGTSDEVLQDLTLTEAAIRGMFELVEEFNLRYTIKKSYANSMDFSDLEHNAIRLLVNPDTHTPTLAAKSIAESYVEIAVDEFQDTNEIQETIFNAISSGTNLFTVGDVKQSIYGFRLADPSIFLHRYNTYKQYTDADEGEPRKIILSQNFRSREEILEATNSVMETCMSTAVGGLEYSEAEELQVGRTDFIALNEPAVELCAINMASQDEDPADDMGKVDVEAKYVAQRIKELLDNGTIMDEDSGSIRRIEPNDIAILLRSVKNTVNHYTKALRELEVPCKSTLSGTIMETTEVATLYAYLQILDNPDQDIPLIAVLCSPLFGFTAADVASIRSRKKKGESVFVSLEKHSEQDPKSKAFISSLATLREASKNMRLSALFSEILYVTDAEDVFGSMANGEQRMANIHKFSEMIATYESTGYKGLFDFLLYLEDQMERGKDLPQATGTQLLDSAVSIVSIHASKGLEYPVVVLADLSRRFNTNELKSSVLLHRDLGVGVQVINKEPGEEYRYPTIARDAIASCKAAEAKSEELRILYVAMTRAKQRLIMTYAEKLTDLVKRMVGDMDVPLHPAVSQSVSRPGDWVLYTALTRAESTQLYALAGQIPALARPKALPWKISVIPASDIGAGKMTAEEMDMATKDIAFAAPVQTEILPAKNTEQIERDIAFKYPHLSATLHPSKATATQVAKEVPAMSVLKRQDMGNSSGFTAAERGSATHLFLQYANFSKCCGGRKDIEEELARLVLLRFIPADLEKAVMLPALTALFSGPVGKEIAMLNPASTKREFEFLVALPAKELYGSTAPDDDIMFQGVIDLYTETKDGIVIYDYKTDFVKDDVEEEAKAKDHKAQLDLYGLALEHILHRPVIAKNVVFVRTGNKICV